MKPISLPITLLGRIAPLASKPSREELLKEVSEPITISDLMKKENNDWISEAFAKAGVMAEKTEDIIARIQLHFNEKSEELLHLWGRQIGDEISMKMIRVLIDEDVENALTELTKTFLVAGYLSALDDVKSGKFEA